MNLLERLTEDLQAARAAGTSVVVRTTDMRDLLASRVVIESLAASAAGWGRESADADLAKKVCRELADRIRKAGIPIPSPSHPDVVEWQGRGKRAFVPSKAKEPREPRPPLPPQIVVGDAATVEPVLLDGLFQEG